MKFIDRLIGKQIRQPSGIAGMVLGHLMASEHRKLVQWMLDFVDIQASDRVLDVGCGGGMTLRMIAASAREGFTVGVDYSPTMVKQSAKRNKSGIDGGEVAVLSGNVLALPFINDCFDKVCGVETFYFWPDPLVGLREIRRVLKPGGSVSLVMDISKEVADDSVTEDIGSRLGFQVYSGEEIKTMLLEAGFTDVRHEAIPDRGKGWLCVLGA